MGVKRYHNKWRVYCVDKNGQAIQKYYDTKLEADAVFAAHKKSLGGHTQVNKRRDAKHQDLPVGLQQSIERKPRVNGGETICHMIKATCCIEGKMKYFQRSFGKIRTRQEAIKLCKKWRDEMIKS